MNPKSRTAQNENNLFSSIGFSIGGREGMGSSVSKSVFRRKQDNSERFCETLSAEKDQTNIADRR